VAMAEQGLQDMYGSFTPEEQEPVEDDFVPSEAVKVSVVDEGELPEAEGFAAERDSKAPGELRTSRVGDASELADVAEAEVDGVGDEVEAQGRVSEAASVGEAAAEADDAAEAKAEADGEERLSEAMMSTLTVSRKITEEYEQLSTEPEARSSARVSQASGLRTSQVSGGQTEPSQQATQGGEAGRISQVSQLSASGRKSQQSEAAGSEAKSVARSSVKSTFNVEQVKEIVEQKQQTGCRLSRASLDDGQATSHAPPVTYGSLACACGEKISGTYLEVEGKAYHKTCFVCSMCCDGIEGTYFKTTSGDYRCRSCHRRDAPSCEICQQIVMNQLIRVGDKTYHLDCLRCSVCMNGIVGNFFVEPSGTWVCQSCAVNTTPACGVCSSPVFGQTVKAEGKEFHPACFVCTGCKKPLGGGKYFNKDGTRNCVDCNGSADGNSGPCPVCGEKLTGANYIAAEGKKYHSQCFPCDVCGDSLGNQQYMKAGGKNMCEPCYRKECPSLVCAVCDTRITHEYVGAKDKYYHKDCFRCIFCIQHITGGFHATDEGPVCPDCK